MTKEKNLLLIFVKIFLQKSLERKIFNTFQIKAYNYLLIQKKFIVVNEIGLFSLNTKLNKS